MPALTTRDFDGVVTPAALQLASREPLARRSSLRPQPRPAAHRQRPCQLAHRRPRGWGLDGRGRSPCPSSTSTPGRYTVVVKKLAGVFDISNELIADAAFNIAAALGQAIADRLGVQLDDGVIRGGGDPEDSPVGVWGFAPAVPDAPLWPGIWSAVGELGDAGGAPTHVALRPSTWAAEAARADDVGRPLYPDGLVQAGGLTFVQVPSLDPDESLIFDAAKVRLIVRRDFSFEVDASAGFARDVSLARVIGRFAVGVPNPQRAIRKLTIADEALGTAGDKVRAAREAAAKAVKEAKRAQPRPSGPEPAGTSAKK